VNSNRRIKLKMRQIAMTAVVLLFAGSVFVPPSRGQGRNVSPVTDAMLESPDPGDWLMWRRTQNGWAYSPLDQINQDNVDQLRLVWTHGLGAGNNQEGTPLVHDGVLFMPNPGDFIQAFDAATGDLLWEHQRDIGERGRGTNRNLAIFGNRIIDTSLDNHVFALDTATGEMVWETEILDPSLSANASSGPIIAGGKVIAGRQCQPAGGQQSCIITAHDAATGEELWRTGTIPKPGEPGDESWGGVPYEERWHIGTWMVPSYDPELNLIYTGTSVTIPAPKFILGGNGEQHLYHNSTLALDGDTGEIVWYYQHLVDHWDLDHPFERLLVDTAVTPDPDEVEWINPNLTPGEVRKVLTGIPGKTGVVYTLDRETGEFLWARPTVMQNVITTIDGSTGAVVTNEQVLFDRIDQEHLVCPGSTGGKNWPAGAYSPRTNAMYYPLQNLCMTAVTTTDQRDPRAVYGIRMSQQLAAGTTDIGSVIAVSAETGRTVWNYQQRAGVLSLVTTGGGLVFGGDANGRFRAFDDETGEVLWEVNLGAPVSGFPVSFAVDGRQYVAVGTGFSLVARTVSSLAGTNPGNSANLFVFALP